MITLNMVCSHLLFVNRLCLITLIPCAYILPPIGKRIKSGMDDPPDRRFYFKVSGHENNDNIIQQIIMNYDLNNPNHCLPLPTHNKMRIH